MLVRWVFVKNFMFMIITFHKTQDNGCMTLFKIIINISYGERIDYDYLFHSNL